VGAPYIQKSIVCCLCIPSVGVLPLVGMWNGGGALFSFGSTRREIHEWLWRPKTMAKTKGEKKVKGKKAKVNPPNTNWE